MSFIHSASVPVAAVANVSVCECQVATFHAVYSVQMQENPGIIIRFVIPVVFTINYNGVNLLSNTTMWWRDIYYYYYYYYIENNYMFRRLIMAIFRLYMNHLVSSYTNIYIYIWATYIGKRGEGKVGTRYRICQNGWDVRDAWRVHGVIKLCLSLIIAKSVVGIIHCMIVMRNYTKVYHRFSYNKA